MMNFRYDINGLRAIAVIAVVLFHFNPAWVPGGFAGVDVFFVISGFLMTGIIFRGLENDSFNLFKFYVARANRIIPALAVLCLVLLVFGWLYLPPLDYSALSKHVASSMGFLSNVIYWRESGYFDAASHEKWLLHTWSLSVEWQFYILYPIVLAALKRFLSLENLKRLIIVGTVLGFGLSVVATMKFANAAYYLIPTRAWEMMMGGVAFLYPWNLSESKKKVAALAGLALVLGSYAFVSSDVPWPGYFSLLPVLGAYLMIVSNQQSSFITNNTLFQCLGRWSYSIYLWHWPIVVYGYYFDVQGWTLYGLPLSIILGFVSFNFIESLKFKSFSRWLDFLKVKPVYMAFVVVFFSLVLLFRPNYHFEYHFPNNPNKQFFLNGLKLKDSETKDYTWGNIRSISNKTSLDNGVIVLGDSQAGDFTNVLMNLNIQKTHYLSSSIVSAKCGIGYLDGSSIDLWRGISTDVNRIPNLEKTCRNDWNRVKSNLENNMNAEALFYVMNWREYSFDLMDQSIDSIKKINPKIKVVVIGKKATGNLLKEDASVDLGVKALRNIESHGSVDYQSKRLSSFGDYSISLYDKMCTQEKCTVSYHGTPILYDGVHSTISGVQFLSLQVKKEINRVLNLP